MAFVSADLAQLMYATTGTGTTAGGREFKLWVYVTDDSVATVETAAYWAAAGSTSGDGRLTDGDIIYCTAAESGTAQRYFLRVTDDAAGTTAEELAVASATAVFEAV